MNTLPNGFQSEEEHLAFLERVVRYQDGSLSPSEIVELAGEISQDPARRDEFIRLQLRSAIIHETLRREAYADSEIRPFTAEGHSTRPLHPSPRIGASVSPWKRLRLGAGASLAGLLIVLAIVQWSPNRIPVTKRDSPRNEAVPVGPSADGNVFLAEGVHAYFFGKASLPTGSLLEPLQDYMLQKGLVKLAFPNGATAIIEAPAMFRILDQESLALDTGLCSVHAPAGAEGFRVITPVTDVIDRGTRFSVKVNDNNETEVHVVEGAADLFPHMKSQPHPSREIPPEATSSSVDPIRLVDRQAVRLGAFENQAGESAPFDPQTYRHRLPDRIIRYEATRTDKGHADDLVSITVQRGGQIQTYAADELIPIEVIWFRGESTPDPNGHLAGGTLRPQRPQDWLEDRKLNTGIINFGGQPEPLERDPVMPSLLDGTSSGTPGLGIRFQSPVVNRPGPDMVLFELQCFTNPLDGDPFHVSPVRFRPGLKSTTIRKFDLTMNSPETLEVPPFWLHRYPGTVDSLAALIADESLVNTGVLRLRFRALAVGIDLSDLGYAEGEQVAELFFQHATVGDASRVDPVFIAGLPELK